VVPTVLALAGVAAPQEIEGVAQSPIEGTSFAYLLDEPDATERHRTQYFEMLGSRGIYHDGWKAVTFKPLGHMYDDGLDPDAPFEEDVWELYHVAEDRSETVDLAAAEPARLQEMVARWWEEARRYQVLPLDNRPLAALLNPRRPPPDRPRWVVWPRPALVPESVAANVRNRPHVISAEVSIAPGDEGVLVAMGNGLGGWSFHVHDGRLRYVNCYLGKERHVITATAPLDAGDHQVQFSFETAGDYKGTGRLLVDGVEVGSGPIARVTPARYSITGGGLTCGWEHGPAVGTDYAAPFSFTGVLRRVVIEVDGHRHRDAEEEYDAIMSEQ
jgi:arylsulfatase